MLLVLETLPPAGGLELQVGAQVSGLRQSAVQQHSWTRSCRPVKETLEAALRKTLLRDGLPAPTP